MNKRITISILTIIGVIIITPYISQARTLLTKIIGDPFLLQVNWKRGLLFYGGFEGYPTWKVTMKPSGSNLQNAQVVKDPKNKKNRVLKATYLKGSYSSDASPVGTSATIFRMNFNKSGINIPTSDKLYLRYDVLFPKGFQFAKSGKMPGLAGGTSNTGGHPPNGYDGFSVRSVWRGNGGLESYLYIPGIQQYGLELPWSVNSRKELLTTDKWHCVVMVVQLNTPGHANGLVRGWIDNKLGLNSTSLNFRSTSKLNIDNIMFDTFFGGDTQSFASPVTQSAFFDNIMVSKEKIGCEKP